MTTVHCKDCKFAYAITAECSRSMYAGQYFARAPITGDCGPEGKLFEPQVGMRPEAKAAIVGLTMGILMVVAVMWLTM